MLTIKSDDVVGRVKAYEKIVKGENIPEPGVPESFKVLLKELQAIGLDVQILNEDGDEVVVKELEEEDEATPEQTEEIRRVMEGEENGNERLAAELSGEEPVHNGEEEDVMSGMGLDVMADIEAAAEPAADTEDESDEDE